jgi:hypothetical protein
MKRQLNLLGFLGFGLLIAVWPAAAHHGFYGAFDLNTPTTFDGVITDVDWRNPHIVFNVDIKNSSGAVTNWRFEGAGPVALRNRGLVRGDLRVGDTIRVVAHRAMNGSAVAAVGTLTLPDGRTLDAASDGVRPTKTKK